MNTRDELQMTIFRSNRLNTQVDLQSDRRLEGSQLAWAGYAASAVRAAGYRKPRTIEDTHADDGPDSLPPLSVILSGGKPAIKQYDHTFMDYDGVTWDYWELEAPITVLYVPEVTP